jgi:diguanylate cyclase (GGDEF)-like protein
MVNTLITKLTKSDQSIPTSVLEEQAPTDLGPQRRVRIVGAVMIFFTVLTLLFSIDALYKNTLTAAVFLAALTIMNIIGLRWHYNNVSHGINRWLAGFTMFTLCFYSLSTGAAQSLSTFWGLAIIGSSFYILGFRRGLICTAIIFSFTALLMLGLASEKVKEGFLINDMRTFSFRYLSVMALIAIFASLQEYERSRAVKHLLLSREHMRHLASTDELTGLVNRRTMAEQLRQQEHRCNEQHEQYSVILCDIDLFKNINDTYGHEVGDKVLTGVATILKNNLREFDMVARWGGEEFLVMLPRTNIEGATQAADKLHKAINEYQISHEDVVLKPTLSFGVACGDADIHFDECVRQADRRLYKAKHLGRNCVVAKDTHDDGAT